MNNPALDPKYRMTIGGHATALHLWVLAVWALAGVVGLLLVTTLRHPAPAPSPAPDSTPAEPVSPPLVPAELVPAQPITLVVGFDNSEPARRALTWGADLLRARPGTLHVVYADHALIGSDLTGLAKPEMEEDRDAKATSVQQAVAQIAAAAGVPYTFERRKESPADAILSAASSQDAADPVSTPSS